MLEVYFILLLNEALSLLWDARGILINFVGMFGALYLSELMIVGRKSSSLKKTFVISLIYTIVGEIAGILLFQVPVLVFLIQVVVLGLLINYYYEESWVIIFSVTLVIVFFLMLILALARTIG